tara:strand:+ start:1183 stop:1359 length:177 start_codon:yes stop_codon:yes gene_type:complete
MEITNYQVLREKTESILQMKVNRLIRQGWSPLGGVSAAAFGISPVGGNSFLQAMVKYK